MEVSEIGELDQRRQELNLLYRKAAYNQIGKVEGVTIVGKRKDFPDQDCVMYALQMPIGEELFEKVRKINELPEVEERRAGDFVLYLNHPPNRSEVVSHMGVLQEDGTVVSKWNDGHVYKHGLMLVPSSFADSVRVVRGQPDVSTNV